MRLQKLTAEGAEKNIASCRWTCFSSCRRSASGSRCAAFGLQSTYFGLTKLELNNTCSARTSMLWKMGEPPARFVLQFNIPRTREEARCDRSQVNPISWYGEENIDNFLFKQSSWHFKAVALQRQCAVSLPCPQRDGLGRTDRIPVDVHMNVEALGFLWVLAERMSCRDEKKKGPQSPEH
jgi:hypothetical protein